MNDYNKIESKWQKIWEDKKSFTVKNGGSKEKYYILVEFPYPSGQGLHVGHVRSYSALDAMARVKRMQGFNVLFPMGMDAFGSPAEQYAIKHKINPREAVEANVKIFSGQMKKLGFSFDWDRFVNTSDPKYYKWTQWQFLKFYEAGMAYKAEKEINWCPVCKTGLSNEDAAGGVCERCGTKTIKKLKNQWLLKMQSYADSLIDGLKDTDFLEKIKTAQVNWIGRSEGAEVDFKIEEITETMTVFTTRPDTLFGVTFMVMSPEHQILTKYKNKLKNLAEIEAYQKEAASKDEIERTDMTKEKTGVKIDGLTAINPINNQEIPIYISDYVLASYGTGAIMAVPAHDERDYAFAKKFGIEIIPVIEQITGIKRDNETLKQSIVALVYNPKTNKYLTLNWHEKGGRLLIGGTLLKDEDPIAGAKREIIEETGYCDIKHIASTFPINHHYYAFNKDKAYEIDATGIYFELVSDKKESLNLEEDEVANFDVEWVDEATIINEVKDELHFNVYNQCKNPTAYIGDGKMINSGVLTGLTNKEESIAMIIKYLEDKKIGRKMINYRLQDWIFSRQRFWGEPIPMINCEKCGWMPVPYEQLPVVLPEVSSYEPTETGESPLANIPEWVNTTCPKCGGAAQRETDTMPNWAGSSWYWLRYMDANNDNEFVSQEALKYWNMVDYYNGGMEHATRHLLYARFWNHFLYNQGLVPFKEPFKKRVAHGMILGENGEKMSKSKGNVVNPDDMIAEYGADALRTYELFIGDYEKDATWQENGLKGCKRFLDKVIRIGDKLSNQQEYSLTLESIINKTIKKVTEDIVTMNYNTAVSALMILANAYDDESSVSLKDYKLLLTLLNPIAPHITEELNEKYKLGGMLFESEWPTYDEAKTIDNEFEIGVQVNGKLRSSIKINLQEDQTSIEKKALAEENVIKHIAGKQVVKVIVIPNKIVNIVIK